MGNDKWISLNNLHLAFYRITNGSNTSYKNFFRPTLLAYGIALEENLKQLKARLQTNWKPTPSLKLYIPKPSGLQRPISYLPIEDQIVYQAFANIVAEKVRNRRRHFEGTIAFSNQLNTSNDKHFLKYWKASYQEFQKEVRRQVIEEKRVWVAKFDLTSFYDTISHRLLLKIIAPRACSNEQWNTISSWLSIWASSDFSKPIEHGLPQGPIASDFLSEVFLMMLDEPLSKINCSYVRYGDDIRLLGISQESIQKAVLQLDVTSKELGLIPHGEKAGIQKIKTVKEALYPLPSIPNDGEIEEPKRKMVLDKAEKLFYTNLEGHPKRIVNKSIAKHVLFNAPKSEKLLKWTLKLISRQPEYIDAYAAYLTIYKKSTRIERELSQIVLTMPYSYVRGEIWRILAKLASPTVYKKLWNSAVKELDETRTCVGLQRGVITFLLKSEDHGYKKLNRRKFKHCHDLAKSLVISSLTDNIFNKKEKVIADILIKDNCWLSDSVLGVELITRRLSYRDFGVKVKSMSFTTQNILRELGAIKRRSMSKVDVISQSISQRYGIDLWDKWYMLLGREYKYAAQLLKIAESSYDSYPTNWMKYQNSFNDLVIRRVIDEMEKKKLLNLPKTKDKNGNMIRLGILVQRGNPFSRTYPNLVVPIQQMNDRRNKLPPSHPYDEKTGKRNSYLSVSERDRHKSRMAVAFKEIATILK